MMDKRPEWAAHVRRVTPYVPGEQPNDTDMIKLNTNENPYPPSPAVFEACRNLDPAVFCRYTELSAGPLVGSVAADHGN